MHNFRVLEIELNKGKILHFCSAQPAPVLGKADLRYHRSRLRQNAQNISCKVKFYLTMQSRPMLKTMILASHIQMDIRGLSMY